MQKLGLVDEVIALDVESRATQQEADSLRSNRKTISKQIGALMGQGKREEAEELKAKVNEQADRLARIQKLRKLSFKKKDKKYNVSSS